MAATGAQWQRKPVMSRKILDKIPNIGTVGPAAATQATPITRENFEARAAAWGRARGHRDNWPFLSSNPSLPGTADQAAWLAYFDLHLGGKPRAHGQQSAFQAFAAGRIEYYNLPEAKPEDFDASYRPGSPGPEPERPRTRWDDI